MSIHTLPSVHCIRYQQQSSGVDLASKKNPRPSSSSALPHSVSMDIPPGERSIGERSSGERPVGDRSSGGVGSSRARPRTTHLTPPPDRHKVGRQRTPKPAGEVPEYDATKGCVAGSMSWLATCHSQNCICTVIVRINMGTCTLSHLQYVLAQSFMSVVHSTHSHREPMCCGVLCWCWHMLLCLL